MYVVIDVYVVVPSESSGPRGSGEHPHLVSTVEHGSEGIGGLPQDSTGRGIWTLRPGLTWMLPWAPLSTSDVYLCSLPGMDCAHGNPMALLSSVRFSSESLDLKMDLGTQECTPAHIEYMSWGQAIPAPSSLVSKVFFFFLFAEDASDPWSMNTVWICIHVVWGSQESHQRAQALSHPHYTFWDGGRPHCLIVTHSSTVKSVTPRSAVQESGPHIKLEPESEAKKT